MPRRAELPAGLGLDPALEERREPHVLADHLLQPRSTEAAKRGPELQRPEPPPERRGVLTQADHVLAHPQVFRHEAEGAPEVVRAAREEGGAVHRREQPLVRVDADRVGALPAREVVAELGAHGRSAGVGRVDVEPGTRRLRHGPRSRRQGRPRPTRWSPTVATTAQASERSSSSGRSAKPSSTGARRTSSSSRRAAFAVDEWVCSEQTTTRRSGWAARAAASAVIRPDDAVSSRWPCNGSGRPSSWRSQSSVSSSSSCNAGEARQRIPT